MSENEKVKNKTEVSEEKSEGIAMELLKELKIQNKRLVLVLFTVIALWAGTIGLFVWYINQYDYANYDLDSNDGGTASYVGNDMNGDLNNGMGTSESKAEEER